MELKKGTLLQGGKYEIVKKLGQGSFGITYLARAQFTSHGSLGEMKVETFVAIKEFFMSEVNTRHSDGSTVEGSQGSVFNHYKTKFRKEAENLSKLNHTDIVQVYDVFDENGTTYYSMSYIDGGNLDDYIKAHNPLDEYEAISIISHISHALEFMHSRQMLHLDLKPKNIMRSSTGDISLIDFGLSKQFTADGEPESSTTIGSGTPGYAPIEQARLIKDGTFPATLDIYALGATMYKILTGERPADASDILNDGFPTRLLTKYHRSSELIKVVRKCMAPMKKDRYQSINELLKTYPELNNPEPPTEDEDTVTIDDDATEIHLQKETPATVLIGANKYEGPMVNGRPHGHGTLTYCDGKKYIGDFVNGLRHGQGTLIMPNGESFKGKFINDSITEEGIYYDENGQQRNIAEIKARSIGSKLWDKTWRLWASIACFGMAALAIWAIMYFFSGDHASGVVRVSGFIAPIVFGWWGLKNLLGFFAHLFKSNN